MPVHCSRPARLRRPKNKRKLESAVGVVEHQVLAPLRNRTFFNPAELNGAIGELVVRLNSRPFQKLEGSRRSPFEDLDGPALRRLPGQRYEFAEWKKARVNIEYHVEVDHNYYSVPYALVRDVALTYRLSVLFYSYGALQESSSRRSTLAKASHSRAF